MYTSAADTDEVIDDALARFGKVCDNVDVEAMKSDAGKGASL